MLWYEKTNQKRRERFFFFLSLQFINKKQTSRFGQQVRKSCFKGSFMHERLTRQVNCRKENELLKFSFRHLCFCACSHNNSIDLDLTITMDSAHTSLTEDLKLPKVYELSFAVSIFIRCMIFSLLISLITLLSYHFCSWLQQLSVSKRSLVIQRMFMLFIRFKSCLEEPGGVFFVDIDNFLHYMKQCDWFPSNRSTYDGCLIDLQNS